MGDEDLTSKAKKAGRGGSMCILKLINTKLFTIFILLLLMAVHGFGESDVNYIDLGSLQINEINKYYEIFLPYFKPEGITQVPTKDINAIVIHKLKADGMQIHPDVLRYATADGADKIYMESAKNEGEYRKLKMLWGLSFEKDVLSYRALTGRTWGVPEQYRIPFGTKEVFLTYSIRFLIYDSKTKLTETIESEVMTVKWNLEWNVAD